MEGGLKLGGRVKVESGRGHGPDRVIDRVFMALGMSVGPGGGWGRYRL